MKKQFQSKSVPRGTRTIWRYLGALFILFTFAVGNVWAADYLINVESGNLSSDSKWYQIASVGGVTNKTGSTWDEADVTCSPAGAKIGSKNFTVRTDLANTTQITVVASSGSNRTISSVKTGTSVSSLSDATGCTTSGSVAKNTCGQVLTFTFDPALSAGTYVNISMSGNMNVHSVTITAGAATKHHVTYKLNGATGTTPTQADVAEGAKFTLHNGKTGITAPTNKDFDGWHDGTKKYAGGAEYTMGTSDVELTAQWVNHVAKYTVIYKDGTTELGSETVEVGHHPTGSEIAAPTKDCYTFADWSPALDEVSGTDGATVYVDATWTPKYASTLDFAAITTAGTTGSNPIGTFLASGNMVASNLGSKSGWETSTGKSGFIGYKLKNTSAVVKFLVKAGKEVEITLGSVGAAATLSKGGVDSQIAKADGDNAETVIPAFVAEADMLVTITTSSDATVTLKKISIVDPATKYTVTYALNGATGTTPTEVSHKEGEKFNLHDGATGITAPTNKTFVNWKDQDDALFDGGAEYTMPAKNVTLTAQWAGDVYTVKFMDGETVLDTKVVEVGSHPTDIEHPTKPLYTFAAWQLSGSDVVLDDVSGAKDAVLTLTARWAKVYATSYDMEAYAASAGADKDGLEGELTAAGYAYTNINGIDNGHTHNYTYDGMKYKTNDGDLSFNVVAGKVVEVKTGHLPSDDAVTMYINGVADATVFEGADEEQETHKINYFYSAAEALYRLDVKASKGTCSVKKITIRDPYQVSYIPHGADAIDAQNATPSVTLPTPVNGTGNFKGWYDAETEGNKIGNAGASYTPTANITLHAQWEVVSTDNTLSDLQVDGATVAGFDPAVQIYNLVYEYGQQPVITSATATAGALATVTINNTPVEEATFKYVQVKVEAESGAERFYQVRYTNNPKQGATIFKAELTSNTAADYSGMYADGDNSEIKLADDGANGYKFSGKSNYIKMAITDATFAEGDMLKMTYTTNPQQGELAIYDGTTKLQGTAYGNHILTFSDAADGKSTLFIRRTDDNNFNGWVAEVEVQRYMAPIIKSYKIGAVSGTIDQEHKTIAIELPFGTSLSGVAATIEAYANGGATVIAPTPLAYDTPLGYKVSSAYAEDGDVDYTVTITEAEASHEATLSDIKLDGVSLEGFDPATLSYNVELEKGTLAYPTVTYTAATGATVVPNSETFPGAYNLVVTAEDGSTTQTYTINFTVSTKIKVVIYNGNAESAEAALKASPDVTTGASWSLVGSLTNGEKELAPYHYSILTNGSTSDTKHIAVTTPENYIPYFEIVQVTNSNNKDRRAFVALKKKASEVGETDSLLVVASSDIYTPVRGMSGALEEGKTYYIHATNSINFFEINLYLEPIPAKCEQPTITSQPATKTDFGAGNMTATVVAEVSDGGTLKYQWYNASDDSEVTGQTTATLTTAEEGTYYVIVTNTLDDHRDNSIKSDEAQLAHRVMNDATLSALSYGTPATAITLETDKYAYRVDLAMGTLDVPELTATATMAPYSVVSITNATEFVNYEATSTVLVTAEDGVTQKTYTVKFVVDHIYTALVDVTESTTWNWTGSTEAVINDVANKGLILANYIDGANFEMIEGKENERARRNQNGGCYQGTQLHFNTTVYGKVKIYFRAPSSGDNCTIYVNNNGKRMNVGNRGNSFGWSKEVIVKGDVVVEMVKDGGGETRVQQIVFTQVAPDYTREVSNNIGTLCVNHNVLAGGFVGATFYQIASRNEIYNDKIDFEEVGESEELVAGQPYIFQSTTGRIDLFYGATEADAPVAVRGMIGSFVDTQVDIDEENKSNILYIANNRLWNCEDMVGSYLDVVANRAYIVMSDVPEYSAPQQNSAPRRRVTLGKDATQTTTGVDNLNASEQPVKLLINGQIFILRGEKLFDVTGKLVK